MRNILITGGAGNVASSLADRLLKNENNRIIIADDLSTGALHKVPQDHPNCEFFEVDANDKKQLEQIFSKFSIDYVFHYAAVVGVKRTLEFPNKVLDDIDGFRHILDLCVEHKVKRFFFSSSSEVYGEPVEIPQFEETTPLNAKLPYAVVKNVGEVYAKAYNQLYDLPYTIFRFFNTYGPKQSADFVIAKFITQALRNDDITIYGDGSQTRTFCYIDDNTDATEQILENNLFINDTLNLGSDIVMTIKQLAHKVIDVLGSNSKVIHLPPLPDGDMKRRCPDISKMKTVITRDLVSLEEGILKTAASLKEEIS